MKWRIHADSRTAVEISRLRSRWRRREASSKFCGASIFLCVAPQPWTRQPEVWKQGLGIGFEISTASHVSSQPERSPRSFLHTGKKSVWDSRKTQNKNVVDKMAHTCWFTYCSRDLSATLEMTTTRSVIKILRRFYILMHRATTLNPSTWTLNL